MNSSLDLDMVAEVDDIYWEKTAEDDSAFTQPVGAVSLISFFTHYLKLVEIAASVQRSIVSSSFVTESTIDEQCSIAPMKKVLTGRSP